MGPASVVPRIVDAPAGVIMLTLFAAELVVYTLPAESTVTEFGPAPVVSEAPPVATPLSDPIREAVAAISPDQLSPREALEALYRLRDLLV